ncbi:hypothetical protein [Sulfurirhabdus autotrophica]|uniref:Uncharacterized protein n=1 Tax=Sulfurirhabdus autotrophica TaxID=1706046 RepID=A0A4R3XY46_9PROT|nr:hypothetical protein [Sulfurirhabdus autotrophica]TCV82714.1 hypothetical protein EDC63_11931 [Sulfurirhabdus autotrophica]
MKNHLRLVSSNDETLNEPKTKSFGLIFKSLILVVFSVIPIIRYTLFLILVFLRIPVNFISHLVVGPLIFGAIAWGFIAGWTSTAAVALGGAAFICFAIGFAFDSIVLLLAPEGYFLEM